MLNDILQKLKFDKDFTLTEAHHQILDLLAVSGWIAVSGNEHIFGIYANRNCMCLFDDGTECRYDEEHPMAILTHFRCK